ncbi:AAA family ATPase [Streptomyces litchfieldiae]|uniref:WXG100 family type VII secretion target n=1 Tax=Streptomyces litchfieldiae TaxID=3075543 RepID=A0ABU2MWU7_9ACTN|nr:hypothetical protein [Streptomyces sp. DSM 44938]MDT0345946.1 hypothetical protein [Streptomyces sp. DSM 44938]
MGSRPSDWYPLTENGEDPVPGDWELVQEAAARYRRTADSIQRAQTLLTEVTSGSDGWEGKSGEAFRDKAAELSDNVFRAYGRYDATANALAEYWPRFQEAQDESLRLRTQALEAHDEITRRERLAEASESEDSETHDDHEANLQNLEAAQAELNRLRNRLAQVVEDKDVAAQRAADAIGDFIGDDGLEDGWGDRWDSFCSGLSQAVALLGEIAGQVAMIAGILALCLAWVPVLGQALAAVALIATAISLAANLYNGNWNGVVWDAIGLATFGVGRVASAMTRAARAKGLMRAHVRSTTAARSGTHTADELEQLQRNVNVSRAGAWAARDELDDIRSVADGRLGWAGHAFHNLGSDLGRALRAPFDGRNWGVRGGGLRHWIGATPMSDASRAVAAAEGALGGDDAAVLQGNARDLRRAAGVELGALAGGAALGAFTVNDNWNIHSTLPLDFEGWHPERLPFTNLPGVSVTVQSPWSGEAAAVGEFSYQESEAMPR